MADDKTRMLSSDEAARLAALMEKTDDRTRVLSADEAARLAAALEPADDRTRVLSAEEAARILGGSPAPAPAKAPSPAEDHSPKFIGSKIVFFCENGHKITVERSLAGKRGTCQGKDKQGCGVEFIIPVPPDFQPSKKPTRADEKRDGAGWGGSLAPPFAMPTADVGDASPVPDLGFGPGVASSSVEPALDLGAAPVAAASEEAAPGFDFMNVAASAADAPLEFAVDPQATIPAFDLDQIDNPTAQLLARLWLVKKEHGGVIEVQLSGGSVIMPEFFDPRLSCGSHALFAAAVAEGNYTLTVVAWDQIQKVVLRQVPGLPEGMFED